MMARLKRRLLVFCVFSAGFNYLCSSTEVCTNTILPGSKGGPGETGLKGEVGHKGKMGSIGDKGDKGDSGLAGPFGLKGKPGTTCDCGRYRKVVGQLDVSVGKLRNAVKFVKNVILGLRETEERYYLLVKEPRRFREALMGCKLRGGTLAMPKTSDTNRLIADYVSHAGLTGVYIGLQAQGKDMDGARDFVYADASPLRGFAAWSQGEELGPNVSPPTNSSCVELLSTGTWGQVECDVTMFFICEFPKSRRRGGAGRGGGGGGVAPTLALS
ncbi:collectin-10 isoform 2-T2 [Polymixia lowei]